jgi:hypothetical protein
MAVLGQYADQLPAMTEDEVVLAVSQHLLEQKVKSIIEPEPDDNENYAACVYNGGNVCCAAAIFIKDYEDGMEDNGGWNELVADFNQCGNHEYTILYLQSVHDGHDPKDWLDVLTVKYCNDEFPKTKAYLEIIEGEKA